MEWTSLKMSPVLSVPDRLSVDIERMILEGRLQPGERLPTERQLGEFLGVSRVSIRQALHELAGRGLIDRKPGRGTVVAAPSPITGHAGQAMAAMLSGGDEHTLELARIMELRAIIEPPIAALAAARVTQRDAEQLRSLVEEMERETDLSRYAELDRAFHQAISRYAHNPLLTQLTDLIATEISPSRRRSLQSEERRRRSSIAHRRIFEAIAAHDAEGAEREARAHVDDVLRVALDASTADEPPRKADDA